MTSHRKLQANRSNAKASTGPKTRRGKVRAAQNARRHGLSVPIILNPVLCAQTESLALEIAGGSVDPEVLALARQVAEAQIDLLRVRQARHELLARTLGNGAADGHDSELAKQLGAMERYARRAASRRKFAIREFDDARPIIAGGQQREL